MVGMRKRSDADGQSRQNFQFESLQTGVFNVSLDVDGRLRIVGSTKMVIWAMQPGDREHFVAAWADRRTACSVLSRIALTLLIMGSNFWHSDSDVT